MKVEFGEKLIIVFIIVLICIVTYGFIRLDKLQNECESKGGTWVSGRDIHLCIKDGLIINH